MAPFYFDHCPTCGRVTKHQFPADLDARGGDCDECGQFTPTLPQDDVYWVQFTNMTDLSVAPALGQYFLGTEWKASSAAQALEGAIPWALGHRAGLPPHGTRVSEEELRRHATVISDREVFQDGYWEAFNKRRQQRPA
jgi:hypothetical protein